MSDPGEVTSLLEAYGRGDAEALNRLLPLIYDELRRLAHRRRYSWRGEQTPGTTSLVHEAYLNLVGHSGVRYEDRRQFFYFASVTMRNILIDNARRRGRRKRSGDLRGKDPDEQPLVSAARGEEMLAVEDALSRRREAEERHAVTVSSQTLRCLTIGGSV